MPVFGAPHAHEDHAVRACYAALRLQESVARYADTVFRSTAHAISGDAPDVAVEELRPRIHTAISGTRYLGMPRGLSAHRCSLGFRSRPLQQPILTMHQY